MAKAQYMDGPIRYCPNCGSRLNAEPPITVEQAINFYRQHTPQYNVDTEVVDVEIGTKTITVVKRFKDKKAKPKKKSWDKPITEPRTKHKVSCNLCKTVLSKKALAKRFGLKLMDDGNVLPIVSSPSLADEKKDEKDDTPTAEKEES